MHLHWILSLFMNIEGFYQRFICHLASVNPVENPATGKVNCNADSRPTEEGIVRVPLMQKCYQHIGFALVFEQFL